jgi:very-short-patch-repair endonuclease
LGTVAPVGVVERALDDAVARGLVSLRELAARVSGSHRGHRGINIVRGLLHERDCGETVVPTEIERRLRLILLNAHLPEAAFQYEAFAGERFLGRVDFAYPDAKLAVEVDGYRFHASLAAFQHDRARQNGLVAEGWTVLRYTWKDVTTRPDWVTGQVRAVLGRLDLA